MLPTHGPSQGATGLTREPGARLTSMRRAPGRPPWLWVVAACSTAAVVNLPLVYIFLRAGGNGLADYGRTVWNPLVGALLGRTVALVVGTVALTALIALAAAWLVVRTDLPARRFWAVALALPLVFPSYVAAFATVAVFGPRGHLQGWLEPLGVERLPAFAYGYSGALLVMSLFTFPYIYLPLVAALRQLDPALEESARGLGAGRWRIFGGIVLPQLRPALYAGSLLVALYALSDFGAVSIVRFNTFTLSIYNAYRGLFDRTTAASLATVLVVLTLTLIVLEAFLVRGLRPHLGRPSRPPERIALGRWRWPCLTGLGLLALVSLGVPCGVVTFWGVRGALTGGATSGASPAALLAPVLNSLGVSLLAALVSVAISIPIAAWSVRHGGRLARVIERMTYSGFALPGLVIALALVFFAARHAPVLYQTVPLLALAYVVRFLPEATASTRSAMAAISPAFEEAARSLGRTQGQVLRSLTLPMILPGLSAGGALVFLTSMKELPATLLLRPIGFETLATEIWSHASEAIYSAASLPALALLVVTAPPLYGLLIQPVLQDRGHAGGATGGAT